MRNVRIRMYRQQRKETMTSFLHISQFLNKNDNYKNHDYVTYVYVYLFVTKQSINFKFFHFKSVMTAA